MVIAMAKIMAKKRKNATRDYNRTSLIKNFLIFNIGFSGLDIYFGCRAMLLREKEFDRI